MKIMVKDGNLYVRHWRKWYWLIGQYMHPLLISLPEKDEE